MNFFDKMAMDASQLQAPEWQGQQQQPQQQKPQGLLGNIRSSVRQATQNPDFMDRLAIGLGGMSMNPNRGIIQSAQNDRLLRRRDQAQQQALEKQNAIKNRTMQHLASMGTPQAINALKYIQAGGNVNEALKMTFAEQKEKGRTVDASQLRQLYPNAEIADGLYNVKTDGTINKVGGGPSVTVNTGDDGGAADFMTQRIKTSVPRYTSMQEAASLARSNLSQVNLLSSFLEESGSGFAQGLKQELADKLGLDIRSDAQASAEAMLSRMVPAQREKGSGPMSDRDLDMFRNALPQLKTSAAGNALIAETLRSIAEYQIQLGQVVNDVYAMTDLTPHQVMTEIEKRQAALINPIDTFSQKYNGIGGTDGAGGVKVINIERK
jgi:hypothetical protein